LIKTELDKKTSKFVINGLKSDKKIVDQPQQEIQEKH